MIANFTFDFATLNEDLTPRIEKLKKELHVQDDYQLKMSIDGIITEFINFRMDEISAILEEEFSDLDYSYRYDIERDEAFIESQFGDFIIESVIFGDIKIKGYLLY